MSIYMLLLSQMAFWNAAAFCKSVLIHSVTPSEAQDRGACLSLKFDWETLLLAAWHSLRNEFSAWLNAVNWMNWQWKKKCSPPLKMQCALLGVFQAQTKFIKECILVLAGTYALIHVHLNLICNLICINPSSYRRKLQVICFSLDLGCCDMISVRF